MNEIEKELHENAHDAELRIAYNGSVLQLTVNDKIYSINVITIDVSGGLEGGVMTLLSYEKYEVNAPYHLFTISTGEDVLSLRVTGEIEAGYSAKKQAIAQLSSRETKTLIMNPGDAFSGIEGVEWVLRIEKSYGVNIVVSDKIKRGEIICL